MRTRAGSTRRAASMRNSRPPALRRPSRQPNGATTQQPVLYGRMPSSVRRLAVSLVLVVLTLVVYAPAVRFDFVSWDDPEYVTKNAHVRGGLSVDGVRWAFTT